MKLFRFHQVNLARYGVMPGEAQEALDDGWATRRRDGDFYEVLGRTAEGRYLQLVVEVTDLMVRVFHGRDMTFTERRRYGRR